MKKILVLTLLCTLAQHGIGTCAGPGTYKPLTSINTDSTVATTSMNTGFTALTFEGGQLRADNQSWQVRAGEGSITFTPAVQQVSLTLRSTADTSARLQLLQGEEGSDGILAAYHLMPEQPVNVTYEPDAGAPKVGKLVVAIDSTDGDVSVTHLSFSEASYPCNDTPGGNSGTGAFSWIGLLLITGTRFFRRKAA